jgi:hypothetical protein
LPATDEEQPERANMKTEQIAAIAITADHIFLFPFIFISFFASFLGSYLPIFFIECIALFLKAFRLLKPFRFFKPFRFLKPFRFSFT